MKWYYAKQGEKFGPIEEEELNRLVQEGAISSDDLVWNQTLGDKWVRASTVFNKFSDSSDLTDAPVLAGSQVFGTEVGGGRGETHNRDLMKRARESLQGRWWFCVGITFIYMVVDGVVSAIPTAGSAIDFIISGPMLLGFSLVFLTVARNQEVGIEDLFQGFQNFGTTFGAYVLMVLFILLWAVLLIIPGIIAAFSYSMTFYIIADDPSVGPYEALKRSKAMMNGKKWKLFCLDMRFLGWLLLCIPTFGIGLLWLVPYITTATAHFYEDVRYNTVHNK